MADYKTNNSTLRTRRRQAEVCKRRYQVDLGQIRLNFSTQALITSQTNPRFVCFSRFTDLNVYNLRGGGRRAIGADVFKIRNGLD